MFESKEHEKAWFIRVTINACKDLLKSFFHKRTVSLDEAFPINAELTEDHREVLEAVLELPEKYKDVIYLHYYEGYTAVEISKLLNKNVNTVYTLLNRAKGLLRKVLGVMILNNRIKDAFAAVHAEDKLKRDTKDFLSTRTASTVKSGNPIRLKKAVAFACLASILMIFGGWRFYMTPVSAISVDVNPSLELGVNRLDRVVAVDGYNDDGTDLAAFVDLRNLNYSDALEVLLNSQAYAIVHGKERPGFNHRNRFYETKERGNVCPYPFLWICQITERGMSFGKSCGSGGRP